MPEISCPHHNTFGNKCDCLSCRVYYPGSNTDYAPGVCLVCNGTGKITIDPSDEDCPHHNTYKNKCDCNSCRIYKPGSTYVYGPGICNECHGTGKVGPKAHQ